MPKRLFARLQSRRAIPGIGDHILLEGPITNRVLRHTSGGAFGMIELEGWPAETADTAEINARHERLNATLKSLAATERVEAAVYVCRGLAKPEDVGEPHRALRPYGAAFARRYIDGLGTGRLYSNRMFIGLHLRPPVGSQRGATLAAKIGVGEAAKNSGGERAIDRARRLEGIMDWLLSELAEYGPSQLGLRTVGRRVAVEPAEAPS